MNSSSRGMTKRVNSVLMPANHQLVARYPN
jgi:hypothetical protein